MNQFLHEAKVLFSNGKFKEAENKCNSLIHQNSNDIEAITFLGIIKAQTGQLEQSLNFFSKAISLDNKKENLHYYKALALYKLGKYQESIENYDQEISLNKLHFESYNNKANILIQLNKHEEALDCLNIAITLGNKHPLVYYNRALVLKELKLFEMALESFKKVLSLDPSEKIIKFIFGKYIHTKMLICDWKDFNENLKKIKLDIIFSNKKTLDPFVSLSLFDDPKIHLIVAKLFNEQNFPKNNILGDFLKKKNKNKIVLGYFSSDFHDHPVSYLISDIFKYHDKNKFRIIGFSLIPTNNNPEKKILTDMFDEYIDVYNMRDDQIAKLSREKEIDIAIDLGGYTSRNRFGIFSYRLAPIQVNFLGYPGTLGSNYIDYIIADKTVIPQSDKIFFTEKIVYLPNSYQCNTSYLPTLNKQLIRKQFNLTEEDFVFGCFNNNFKILPDMFDVWMNILNSVNNSVLVLLKSNDLVKKNLCIEAKKRGISSNRIIFSEIQNHNEHLPRNQLIDLFLDTFPYNAHTTASDALRFAVPVLTLAGSSFASRVAASLLNTIDVPELITYSLQDYKNKAIELGNNPSKLLKIKNKLECNRSISPLFKPSVYTKNIESAFIKMHKVYSDGLEPEHIEISR